MSNKEKSIIMCVANQKGGVAKTTTVVNLAASFASLGKKVLVIDADYQGNSTDILGVSLEDAGKKNLAMGILKGLQAENIIYQSPSTENVDILAGTRELEDVVTQMTGKLHQHHLLKNLITDKICEKYDYIIIDTHPTPDCLYLSAMTISNCYLVPVSPDPESAKGLVYMIHSAEKIRKYLNALIFCAGVIICRYDKNYVAHTSFVERIKNIAKKAQFNVCKSIIPTSASIPAASIATQPVVSWKPNSPIAKTYHLLAKELDTKLSKGNGSKFAIPEINMAEISRLTDDLEISKEF